MMESQGRTKVWFIVALCLLVLVGGYFFAEWLMGGRERFRGAAPDQPPVPLIAPVAYPVIEDLEEVAQYTQDKPLPVEADYSLYLPETTHPEHTRGNISNDIILVEYAGITSLYTQIVHSRLIDFVEKNGDRLYWIFRHYPGDRNEADFRAGQATECITEQLGNDAFWLFLDVLLEERNSAMTVDYLVSKGTQVGADESILRACIEEEQLYDYVLLDERTAVTEAGIYVAPSFIFLNRRTNSMRIIEGINKMEYMQAVLDDVAK